MKKEELNELINRGVPVYKGLILNVNELINISDDKDKARIEFKKINKKINEKLHNDTYYKFFDKNILNTVILKANENNSMGEIYVSYKLSVLLEINRLLDLGINNFSIKNCLEQVNKELDKEMDIRNKNDLMNKYPLLYEEYLRGIVLHKKIINEKDTKVQKDLSKEYFASGMRDLVYYYVSEQRKFFRTFINNFYKYDEALYDIYDVCSYINKEKMDLYIAYKYLQAGLTSSKHEDKQYAIYYLIGYLRSNQSSKAMINIHNKVITYHDILDGYKKLFKIDKELIPYDTFRKQFVGKTSSEAQEIIKENLKCRRVPFVINKDRLDDSHVIEIIKERLIRDYKLNDKKNARIVIDKSLELYKRKIELLEKSPYIEKFVGVNDYNGYISYFYPNSNIICEKFFDNYELYKLSIDEAMYIFKTSFFVEKFSLPKIELIHDKNIRRIYHKGDFESRANKFINASKTRQTEDETLRLIDELNHYNGFIRVRK